MIRKEVDIMLSLGLMLLFVGIIFSVLGGILRFQSLAKLGGTLGAIGCFLGVLGFMFG